MGIVALILGSSFDGEQSNVGTNTIVEPTETIILPKITSIQKETETIQSTSFLSSSEKENISILSLGNSDNNILQKAHAVTSNQLEITINQWDVSAGGGVIVFDSQGNFFISTGTNKIGRVDISSNTETRWTLPNFESPISSSYGTDSSGNVYFGQTNNKLGRLNPNTDVFTEWVVTPGRNDWVSVDQFDNVYFATSGIIQEEIGSMGPLPFMRSLELSSNTVTSWSRSSSATFDIDSQFTFDLAGNVYLTDRNPNKIVKLDVSTNTLTEWVLPSDVVEPTAITVASNGIIFIGEQLPFGVFKIGRLDPSTNLLTEWLLPESLAKVQIISTDSMGNVFFGSNFGRLVPSTNTITQWNLCAEPLKIDSSDVIHFGCGGTGGTIT